MPSKKKIIWVEDDELMGSLLAQKLTGAGFDLYCATSGKEVFESLETLSPALPDLIIVDIMLPDMDGFQILDKLSKDARFEHIPRIVLSNLGNISDQQRARSLGAKKYLVKALNSLDQIVNEVNEVI